MYAFTSRCGQLMCHTIQKSYLLEVIFWSCSEGFCSFQISSTFVFYIVINFCWMRAVLPPAWSPIPKCYLLLSVWSVLSQYTGTVAQRGWLQKILWIKGWFERCSCLNCVCKQNLCLKKKVNMVELCLADHLFNANYSLYFMAINALIISRKCVVQCWATA